MAVRDSIRLQLAVPLLAACPAGRAGIRAVPGILAAGAEGSRAAAGWAGIRSRAGEAAAGHRRRRREGQGRRPFWNRSCSSSCPCSGKVTDSNVIETYR